MTSFDWNAFFQTLASNFAGILIPILIGYAIYWVQGHVKDKAAADAITAALNNAPGAVQQAVQKGMSLADAKKVGVQYVQTVAAADIAREPEKNTDAILTEKVGARLGNENIATNLAIAASPQPENPHPLAAVPAPLDPVTSVAQVSAKASEQVYSAPPPASLRDLLVGRGSSPDPIPVSTIGDKP